MKRMAGLILLVLAVAGSVNSVKRMSGPEALKPTGNAAYDSGRKFGRATVPVLLGGMGVLGLWLLLSSGETRPARSAPADRRSPAASRPPPRDPSLRFEDGGMEIYSGNPALLHLQLGHWLAANPWLVLMALALTAAGGVCLVFKPLLGLALLVTTMIYTGQELRSARQKFYKGNVCPGVVLSARQNLVAVYADLTTTDHGHYPAIQILKQPLHRMTTGRACDGMRVAAAALYFGELKNPAWTNFWPEVIPCVIHDPDENARVFDSIAEAEWRMLEACLAQVPNPTLGLHRIRNLPGGNGNGSGNGWADEALWIPPRPWFKSPAALFAFVALGLVAVVSAAVFVVGALERKRHPREPQFMRPTLASPALQPAMPAPSHPQPGIAQPPTTAPHFPRPAQPTQTGPYVAGGLVEARWAGGWIRGKIDSINPGGFTVRVQLEDARFPHPIVLPTNQIRLP